MWKVLVVAVLPMHLVLGSAICVDKFDCVSCQADSSCKWIQAWTHKEGDSAKHPLHGGGFCVFDYCSSECLRIYFFAMDNFANSSGSSVRSIVENPVNGCDSVRNDELVFHPGRTQFDLCKQASGHWCATILGDDRSTLGGACLKEPKSCKNFDEDTGPTLNFISRVVAAADDIPVPCSQVTNCGDCEAARASGCSWCGMTINSETTTLGKCLETTETCNDSTANTVFPGFDDLLTKQFQNVQLTMGAKPIATANCPAGADPVDSLMFSGHDCAACKVASAQWCSMALYDWGSDSDYSAHQWCVEDAGNCSPKILEAQLPQEVELAVKVHRTTVCSAVETRVPTRCSTHMSCLDCTEATDSECQFCSGSTEVAGAPAVKKSLYGGFCRAKWTSCAAHDNEFDGVRSFADAVVGGTKKTVLIADVVATSGCDSQTAIDENVFNPALQTTDTCFAAGGSWCATTVGGDTSTKGGACLEAFNARSNCAAFHDYTKDLGLVSELQIAPSVTPDASTAAPDSSTAPEPETTTSGAESAASSLFVFMALFTVTAI